MRIYLDETPYEIPDWLYEKNSLSLNVNMGKREYTIIKETEKAFGIDYGAGAEHLIWLPKSQLKEIKESEQ